MIPISRVEMYLAKICGEDVELPIPQTRKEVFLAIIAGESYEKPIPSSRVELYLAKILGDDVPLPLPQSREEIFLAKIAGVEYPLPYPESRIEYWLHKWATYEEWETITGNPVSFTARNAPLKQLKVAFSPKQDLHGYDSPWPAGGGKNKADYPTMISAGAVEQSDGSLYVASALSFNGTKAFQNDGTSGQFSITFIVKNDSTSRGVYPVIKYTDGTYENVPVNSGYTSFTTVTKTTNAEKTVDYIYFSYGSGAVKAWFYIQVEQGATPTAWTPYSNICPILGWDSLDVYHSGADTSNPQTIYITLGSTVYSGTVDVVTGVVTVDMAYRLLNDASKWRSSSGTTDFFYNEDYTDRKLFPSSYTGVICSYVQIREQSGVAYGRWQSATNYRFGIKENGTGLTIDDVKAASTAGKIAICYELAEPFTIQLTPQEVNSLAGDNTMWSNANQPITVEYRKN